MFTILFNSSNGGKGRVDEKTERREEFGVRRVTQGR